jgi:hypothetical protein
MKVHEFADHDLMKFLDNSYEVFKYTIKSVDLQLQKAHLIIVEHSNLQAKLLADNKRRIAS